MEKPNDLSHLNLHLSSALTTAYYVLPKKVMHHRQAIYCLRLNFQASHLCILEKTAIQELNLFTSLIF